MTCTAKNEMDILDLKGNVLSSITTNQMEVYYAMISPDGKFVATSGIYYCYTLLALQFISFVFFSLKGFTPDVRVWEVIFSKSGDFEKTNRAFDLTGHTSGIYSFDFSPDSGLMASVSKDGTWRLYNTNSKHSKYYHS